MKVKKWHEETGEGYSFKCPGCGMAHIVRTAFVEGKFNGNGACWGFNGDLDKPTFTPSILVTGVQRNSEDEYHRIMRGELIEPRPLRCHSFVTDGRIQFLSDCLHPLAGQTVELPEMEDAP